MLASAPQYEPDTRFEEQSKTYQQVTAFVVEQSALKPTKLDDNALEKEVKYLTSCKETFSNCAWTGIPSQIKNNLDIYIDEKKAMVESKIEIIKQKERTDKEFRTSNASLVENSWNMFSIGLISSIAFGVIFGVMPVLCIGLMGLGLFGLFLAASGTALKDIYDCFDFSSEELPERAKTALDILETYNTFGHLAPVQPQQLPEYLGDTTIYHTQPPYPETYQLPPHYFTQGQQYGDSQQGYFYYWNSEIDPQHPYPGLYSHFQNSVSLEPIYPAVQY